MRRHSQHVVRAVGRLRGGVPDRPRQSHARAGAAGAVAGGGATRAASALRGRRRGGRGTSPRRGRRSMRVLIFEPYQGGHRLHYVRTMLPGLTEIGARVTIALASNTPSLPDYASHLAPLSGLFDPDAWLPPAAPVRALPGLLRESIRRTSPDALLVPTADGLAQLVGARRGLPPRVVPRGLWSEVLMLRGSFAYPQPNW